MNAKSDALQFYVNETYWKGYQKFFPKELRCAKGPCVAKEEFWRWRTYQVHLDRIDTSGPRFKVVLLHGAGGYGRFLAPFAVGLSQLGCSVVAPDLPGYGLTVPRSPDLEYEDWVDCVSDLVDSESKTDSTPIVLFGLSLGGMLAYQVAARNPLASAVIATTLADPRQPEVMEAMARFPFLGRLGPGVMELLRVPLDRLSLPIATFAKMSAVSGNPAFASLVMNDKLGGDNHVPMSLLRSMTTYQPAVEPESFKKPLLLAHPGNDTWTPTALSKPFFDRLSGNKHFVELDNCGHAPIEQPGITQLQDAVKRFLQQLG